MVAAVLCVAVLIPATVAAGYYLLLTAVGRRPGPLPDRMPTHRIAVLIPAHNEELTIRATLDSVRSSDYPPHLRPVYVVADNCTDRTAQTAASAGAVVLERTDPDRRGKGYALAFALNQLTGAKPDAVLVLDADGVLAADALRAFDARLAAGVDVVQAAVFSRNADDGPTGFVSAVGADLDTATAAGRDRLGLSVPLRGSGMCFRRSVLDAHPWTAFGLTEDAEYGDRLTAAGVRVRFDGRAVVHGETPADAAALSQQRRRWRDALFVGRGGPLRLLESKPLVLLQLGLTAAVVLAARPWLAEGQATAFALWLVGLVSATAAVYIGAVRRVGLTRRRAGFVLSAPAVVARLTAVTLGGFVSRERSWERTPRNAERQPVG